MNVAYTTGDPLSLHPLSNGLLMADDPNVLPWPGSYRTNLGLRGFGDVMTENGLTTFVNEHPWVVLAGLAFLAYRYRPRARRRRLIRRRLRSR